MNHFTPFNWSKVGFFVYLKVSGGSVGKMGCQVGKGFNVRVPQPIP
jgi:hypothetical protein